MKCFKNEQKIVFTIATLLLRNTTLSRVEHEVVLAATGVHLADGRTDLWLRIAHVLTRQRTGAGAFLMLFVHATWLAGA